MYGKGSPHFFFNAQFVTSGTLEMLYNLTWSRQVRSKSRTGNTLYFFPIRFNKLHFSFVPPRRKDYTGISLATRLLTVSLLSFPLYVSTVEFHERRLSQCPPPLSPHYYYWRYGWFPRLMPNSLAWDAFLNLTSLPSCL